MAAPTGGVSAEAAALLSASGAKLLQMKPLSLVFPEEVEAQYLADVAKRRWPVLVFVLTFDVGCYILRFGARLLAAKGVPASPMELVGGLAPQLLNMATCYFFLSWVNRRSRRIGGTAAIQEEHLLSAVMALAITSLLATLTSANAQDYVLACFFLISTTSFLKIRWFVGTLMQALPVGLVMWWHGINAKESFLPEDALVHINIAWAVGALMSFLSDTYRRQMFANHRLAFAAAEMEVQEAKARLDAQNQLAAAQVQAAQRALIVAREKASNEAKSEFMSLMCHEVRTPLNGCLASAEMLLETVLQEEQRDLAKTIRVSGSILLSTVSNFLDFFKMEAGKALDIVQSDVDVQELVSDVHCIIDAMIGKDSGVGLMCPTSQGVPDLVVGDPDRLRGILLNLYTNAAKFTRRGAIAMRVSVAGPDYRPWPDANLYGRSRQDDLMSSFGEGDSLTTANLKSSDAHNADVAAQVAARAVKSAQTRQRKDLRGTKNACIGNSTSQPNRRSSGSFSQGGCSSSAASAAYRSFLHAPARNNSGGGEQLADTSRTPIAVRAQLAKELLSAHTKSIDIGDSNSDEDTVSSIEYRLPGAQCGSSIYPTTSTGPTVRSCAGGVHTAAPLHCHNNGSCGSQSYEEGDNKEEASSNIEAKVGSQGAWFASPGKAVAAVSSIARQVATSVSETAGPSVAQTAERIFTQGTRLLTDPCCDNSAGTQTTTPSAVPSSGVSAGKLFGNTNGLQSIQLQLPANKTLAEGQGSNSGMSSSMTPIMGEVNAAGDAAKKLLSQQVKAEPNSFPAATASPEDSHGVHSPFGTSWQQQQQQQQQQRQQHQQQWQQWQQQGVEQEQNGSEHVHQNDAQEKQQQEAELQAEMSSASVNSVTKLLISSWQAASDSAEFMTAALARRCAGLGQLHPAGSRRGRSRGSSRGTRDRDDTRDQDGQSDHVSRTESGLGTISDRRSWGLESNGEVGRKSSSCASMYSSCRDHERPHSFDGFDRGSNLRQSLTASLQPRRSLEAFQPSAVQGGSYVRRPRLSWDWPHAISSSGMAILASKYAENAEAAKAAAGIPRFPHHLGARPARTALAGGPNSRRGSKDVPAVRVSFDSRQVPPDTDGSNRESNGRLAGAATPSEPHSEVWRHLLQQRATKGLSVSGSSCRTASGEKYRAAAGRGALSSAAGGASSAPSDAEQDATGMHQKSDRRSSGSGGQPKGSRTAGERDKPTRLHTAKGCRRSDASSSNHMDLVSRGELPTGWSSVASRPMPSRPEQPTPTQWLLFEVMDTGVGISERGLRSLFKDYVQGSDDEMRRPRSKGGTGLGLSICCKQVAVLGGQIGAMSKQGEGSTFWFTVPLQVPELRPTDSASLTGSWVSGNFSTEASGQAEQLHTASQQPPDAPERSQAEAPTSAEGCILEKSTQTESKLAYSDRVTTKACSNDNTSHTTVPATVATPERSEKGKNVSERPSSKANQPSGPEPREDQHRDPPTRDSQWSWTAPGGGRRCQIQRSSLSSASTPSRTRRSRSSGKSRPRCPNYSSLKGRHVLLAEDNLINQTVAKKMLSHMGITCTVAANGAEALAAVTAPGSSFDVVLMDMAMPVMGGVSATKNIRGRGLKVPIVAMTANASNKDRDECLDAGMDGFLSKPVLKDRLAEALSLVLTPPSDNPSANGSPSKGAVASRDNGRQCQRSTLVNQG